MSMSVSMSSSCSSLHRSRGKVRWQQGVARNTNTFTGRRAQQLYRGEREGEGEGEVCRKGKEVGPLDFAVAAAKVPKQGKPSKMWANRMRLALGISRQSRTVDEKKNPRWFTVQRKENENEEKEYSLKALRAETGAGTAAPVAFAFAAGGSIFGTILDVFYVAVLIRILSSWFRGGIPPLLDPVINLAGQITEPVFAPFRQLIPPIRMGSTLVDISGIIVILLINFLRRQVY